LVRGRFGRAVSLHIDRRGMKDVVDLQVKSRGDDDTLVLHGPKFGNLVQEQRFAGFFE
jgi:hypothetical protein